MKARMLLLLTVASAAPAVFGLGEFLPNEAETLFKHWVQEHSKDYGTEAEHHKRFGIFQMNLRTIHKHNKNTNYTYKLGLGPFTDLTGEEFDRDVVGSCMLDIKPEHERNVEILDTTNSDADIDWTAKTCGSGACVTPVKNQKQCGSCWAFSSTGEIESRAAIKSGTLVSLSEQMLVDCSKKQGNEGCNGGLMDNAFKYVEQKGGLCTEADYPYDAKTGRLCKADSCTVKDAITSYKDVAKNSEDQLGAAIQDGPVSVAIQANKAVFQHYKSGVVNGKCCDGLLAQHCKLDHGVLLVGSVNGAWKVKNSWGPTWGDKGYVMLAKGQANGQGECGIAMQPSYVVV